MADHPLTRLPDEDLNLIAELVLQSGSLKGLASTYGVSYPTIRTRLDRTIARLRDVLDGQPVDPLRDFVATLMARGELSASNARAILDAAAKASKADRPFDGESDGS